MPMGEGVRPLRKGGRPSAHKRAQRMEENNETVILKGRLNGKQRNRLKRLLDMMYSPGELAKEIGIAKNQIYRVYVPLGCPHERDTHNRIEINGMAFASWYEGEFKKASVGEGETFCKTCQKAVKIVDGEEHRKGQLTYVISCCPVCGRKLTRIIDCSRGRR